MGRYFVLICIIALLLAPSIALSQDQNSINLTPFDISDSENLSYLENESGISAYGQLNYVDLDAAENAFKYVEKKTENYIIGTVIVGNYDEPHDVHVYVDTSRWIIAYYLSQEEPGKIIDWKYYRNNGSFGPTKLEIALNTVVGEMSAYLSDINYYDFRYPNATNMTVMIDEETNSGYTEKFRFIIPSDHFLHSKTWAHAVYRGRGDSCKLLLDETTLHYGSNSDEWRFFEGVIPSQSLLYNTYHTVSIVHYDNVSTADSYGAIVLLYSIIN